MTALIVMMCLTLAALAWLWRGFRRDLRAIRRSQLATTARAMRDAGFTKLQRFATMRSGGATPEEIDRAERDANP